jgi:hypothetical protein
MKSRWTLEGIALGLLLLGCKAEPPAPPPAPAPPPPPAAAVTPPAPKVEPPHAPGEVEMGGQIKLPKSLNKKATVFVLVADNDCLAPDAHIIGRALADTKSGRFSIEVFPAWGKKLTVCGLVEGSGAPAGTLYGKATNLIPVEQSGEIVVSNIEIPVTKQAAHEFPPVTAGADKRPLDPHGP